MNNSVIIKEISTEEADIVIKKHAKNIFGVHAHLNFEKTFGIKAFEKVKLLEKRLYTDQIHFCFAAYKGDELVGWCKGYQEGRGSFYMQNSAVLKKYRKQGIYTKMIERMIEKVKKLGFTSIYSLHAMNNNPVIIPKLKAGFIITGLEISESFGTLVRLTYFLNKNLEKVMDYRTGLITEDDEIKQFLSRSGS